MEDLNPTNTVENRSKFYRDSLFRDLFPCLIYNCGHKHTHLYVECDYSAGNDSIHDIKFCTNDYHGYSNYLPEFHNDRSIVVFILEC